MPLPAPPRLLIRIPPIPQGLTIPVLMGQPVVLGIPVLKVQVPLSTLLLPEVSQGIGTVLGVAELEVIGQARAGAAPVGWTAEESKGSPTWGR